MLVNLVCKRHGFPIRLVQQIQLGDIPDFRFCSEYKRRLFARVFDRIITNKQTRVSNWEKDVSVDSERFYLAFCNKFPVLFMIPYFA